MAHSRGKFEYAHENNPMFDGQVLKMLQELYDIELKVRDENLSETEIKEIRQEKSKPIFDKK
jgi:hypothetical protein